MPDQATIDIPREVKSGTIADAPLVKKGFFRRLFEVSFFPFIWLFSSPTKTLNDLEQTSSWMIVELLPNLFSPLLVTTVTFPFYVYALYKPMLESQGREGNTDYYGVRFIVFMLITCFCQFVVLPIVGFVLSFFTWEQFMIEHYKFYHSSFTAFIPISLAIHWINALTDKDLVGTWRIIPPVILLIAAFVLAFAFIKRVPSYDIDYKWGIFNFMHHVAVLVVVVVFTIGLVLLMMKVADSNN